MYEWVIHIHRHTHTPFHSLFRFSALPRTCIFPARIRFRAIFSVGLLFGVRISRHQWFYAFDIYVRRIGDGYYCKTVANGHITHRPIQLRVFVYRQLYNYFFFVFNLSPLALSTDILARYTTP